MKEACRIIIMVTFLWGCNQFKSKSREISITTDSIVEVAKGSSFLDSLTNVEDDCVFDRAKQNDSFLKGIPEFKNYVWVDSIKTAFISLESGDKLKVVRGGCQHFSLIGELIYNKTDYELSDLEYWLEQCKWLSKRIMIESDYQLLVENIKEQNYSQRLDIAELLVHFNNHNNSEWYLEVRLNEEGKVVMDTGYYFD